MTTFNEVKETVKRVHHFHKLSQNGNITREQSLEFLQCMIDFGTYRPETLDRYKSSPTWIFGTPSTQIRYIHIAYSIWKGKTYDRIEKPREQNTLRDYQWKIINAIIQTFPVKQEQTENV